MLFPKYCCSVTEHGFSVCLSLSLWVSATEQSYVLNDSLLTRLTRWILDKEKQLPTRIQMVFWQHWIEYLFVFLVTGSRFQNEYQAGLQVTSRRGQGPHPTVAFDLASSEPQHRLPLALCLHNILVRSKTSPQRVQYAMCHRNVGYCVQPRLSY
jgi:hypothetical protein